MASPAPLRPLDTLWQAQTIIWIILAGEALALVLALAPDATRDRLAYFGIASLVIQWVALMSLGMLYLLRHHLAHASPPLIAQVALACLLLSTCAVSWLAWLTLRDLWLTPLEGWRTFAMQSGGISLTVGLLGLAAFRGQWHARQLAIRAKQAELEALRARIRPHFLFNTINTGVALLREQPDVAEKLLLDLSDLFRAAIAGREQIPLQEELSLTRRYLEIEQLRFGDRLEVRWDIPDSSVESDDVSIPPLSIQPLVENAIKHGIEPALSGGYVKVGIRCDAAAMVVTIRNALPTNMVTHSSGHNVGLSAVRARIEAFTGGEGGLRTHVDGGEYIAELSVPLSR